MLICINLVKLVNVLIFFRKLLLISLDLGWSLT